VRLVPEWDRCGDSGRHRDWRFPAQALPVEELPLVVGAASQPVVEQDDGQIGSDPVGDREQEVLVMASGADLCLVDESDDQPERAAGERDEGAA